MIKQNQNHLRSISIYAENLVEKAETFIQHSESEQSEVGREILFNSWRIVVGEQRSISHHIVNIQPHYMGDMEAKWSMLQYSLFRVDMLLNALTMKFLEQGSYAVSTEEFVQLQAVIMIYNKIHEEAEKASKHPELIIDELTEPILLIDPYYSSILKEHGGRY
jgi:hypothetical protein